MQTRGFTLVELAIVIGIFAVIIGIVGGFVGASTTKSDLRYAATQALEDTRRAQWQTMSGEDHSAWSVHFDTQQFVLFKGVSYNALDPDNLVTSVESPLTISSISLNGGGNDVLFDHVFGNSSTYGFISFTNAVTGETLTMNINQIGSVDLD